MRGPAANEVMEKYALKSYYINHTNHEITASLLAFLSDKRAGLSSIKDKYSSPTTASPSFEHNNYLIIVAKSFNNKLKQINSQNKKQYTKYNT